MGRKKKNDSNSAPEMPEVLQDESFVDRNPQSSTPESPTVKSMRVKMDENGTILWDQMSESNKEQLKNAAANDTSILEHIAGGPVSDGPGNPSTLGLVIPEITNENVKAGLDMLQWVQNFVFKKWFKFDKDIADEVCKFTEDQHTELDPRGARIANQYAPELFKKYQDAFIFCGMLAFYMGLQLQQANNMQIERNKQKEEENKAKSRIIKPMGVVIPPQEESFSAGAD